MNYEKSTSPDFIEKLRSLSQKYGLRHTNRQNYWMALLSIDDKQFAIDKEELDNAKIELERLRHIRNTEPFAIRNEEKIKEYNIPLYYDQIIKDIDRSMWKFCDENNLMEMRDKLELLIVSVLINTIDEEGKSLHYYQGYHEIASVIVLTCDEYAGYSILKKISLFYLRDVMRKTLELVKLLHSSIPTLLKHIDKKLYNFIIKSEVQPVITLAWNITWFNYIIQDLEIAKRLFDFFLGSNPIMPYYLSAALIVHISKNGLYDVPCDFTCVYDKISKFPQNNHIPYEKLIHEAIKYYSDYPPHKIWDFNQIKKSIITKNVTN